MKRHLKKWVVELLQLSTFIDFCASYIFIGCMIETFKFSLLYSILSVIFILLAQLNIKILREDANK